MDKLQNQLIIKTILVEFRYEHTVCSTFNATITDLVNITTLSNRDILQIDLFSISKISYDC